MTELIEYEFSRLIFQSILEHFDIQVFGEKYDADRHGAAAEDPFRDEGAYI